MNAMSSAAKTLIAGNKAKRKLAPGPKRKALGDQLVPMSRDPIGFLLKIAREHPDIATFKLGPQRTFLLSKPEYIEDVLVANDWNYVKGRGLQRARKVLGKGLLTSEGNFHRRQRRLSQPAFHKQRIAAYAAVMAEYAGRARDGWKAGETRDIAQEMMQLTLAIVAKTLFDADVQGEAQQIGKALTEVLELFATFSSPLTALTDKLPTARNRRVKRGKQRLDETIYRIIAEHRAEGEDRGDLLSMLLLAQDAEEGSGGMSDEQLRDEVMTLFLAGHETTANALAWTWYLLSQNPEVEATMHAEIDEVLGGKLPTFEDVPRLSYTERVFTEAMRLYPPVWLMGRRSVSASKIGGYYVPAKSIVLLSQFVTHHDERYYVEPEKFDPDRWLPEARASRPKYSYFPFGGGPRLCIGEQFAWMEGILILAVIAQKWKLRLVPGHPVKTQPLITLRPKNGMKMVIEGR
ncbi:MAG TPA: cytochrome P450 [Blastocatellia bacterium]|nr:cytochrome P450 [Blastocatellia bacterium]